MIELEEEDVEVESVIPTVIPLTDIVTSGHGRTRLCVLV